MRPYQWVKNLFVLAPLVFGRKLGEPAAVLYAVVACAGFCLLSGSLYIFNDLIDATADRAHPEKRFRKCRQELLLLSGSGAEHRQVLGEYTVEYLGQVNNILLGATVVCYALYTVAADTVARFGADRFAISLCCFQSSPGRFTTP